MNDHAVNINGVSNSVITTGSVGGSINNFHIADKSLNELQVEINQLLAQQRAQGLDEPAARRGAASGLAERAKGDITVKTKLIHWGEYLKNAATTGLIGEAAVEVLKLALNLSGLPVP